MIHVNDEIIEVNADLPEVLSDISIIIIELARKNPLNENNNAYENVMGICKILEKSLDILYKNYDKKTNDL